VGVSTPIMPPQVSQKSAYPSSHALVRGASCRGSSTCTTSVGSSTSVRMSVPESSNGYKVVSSCAPVVMPLRIGRTVSKCASLPLELNAQQKPSLSVLGSVTSSIPTSSRTLAQRTTSTTCSWGIVKPTEAQNTTPTPVGQVAQAAQLSHPGQPAQQAKKLAKIRVHIPWPGLQQSEELPCDDASAGVVLCFGDSLTAGINATGTYPQILERLLRRAGHNLKVRNTGNWGDSTSQLLMRFPYVLKDAASRGRIEYILVLGGTNDLIRGGFYCSELLSKLEQIYDLAAACPGAPRVGVLTMPPASLKPVKEQARLHVNCQLREAVQDHPERFLVDLETVDFSLSYDGLHYSPEGYHEFAERAFIAMQPILQMMEAHEQGLQ